MNVASSLTNTKRYTQPVFDSAKTPGSEKQKNKEAWVSANTRLKKKKKKKSLICKAGKITVRFCYFRVRQYRH